MTASLKKSKIRHLAIGLCLLTTCSEPLLAMTAPMAPTGDATFLHIDSNDASTDYSRVLAEIESSPDLVVYRLALNANDAITLSRASRALLLAHNGEGGIAVIYPNLGEPYRSVFSKIIEGVENQAKTRVTSIPVGPNQNVPELANELRRQGIHVVIALGRNGLKAVRGIGNDIGVVIGGVITTSEAETRGMSVYSLAPDPHLLFERLRAMAPAVRRIFVAYDPAQNTWLMRLAREAARNHGLELVAQEASDLKSTMRFYNETIPSMDARRDALWLPQDSITAEETLVLPQVLQDVWTRNLVVFSSSVMHVKRGVLFSLYPDNMQLGRRLASTALGQAAVNAQPGRNIAPLKEVLVAVNLRTASHLGLEVGSNPQNIDLVFPEP